MDMNKRERQALDEHITGHDGEDQLTSGENGNLDDSRNVLIPARIMAIIYINDDHDHPPVIRVAPRVYGDYEEPPELLVEQADLVSVRRIAELEGLRNYWRALYDRLNTQYLDLCTAADKMEKEKDERIAALEADAAHLRAVIKGAARDIAFGDHPCDDVVERLTAALHPPEACQGDVIPPSSNRHG